MERHGDPRQQSQHRSLTQGEQRKREPADVESNAGKRTGRMRGGGRYS